MNADRQAGFVAGAEALIFGVLVFVFGTLVVLNAWAVVDAKFATNAAAREAVRAIVEAPADTGYAALLTRADAAAEQAFAAHGYSAAAVTITPIKLSGSQERCAPVTMRAEIDVTSTIVPGIAGPNTFKVGSTHEEVIDPFRSGLAGEAACGF